MLFSVGLQETVAKLTAELSSVKEEKSRVDKELEEKNKKLNQSEAIKQEYFSHITLLFSDLKEDIKKNHASEILSKLDEVVNVTTQVARHSKQISDLNNRVDDIEFSAGMHICVIVVGSRR